MFGSLHQFCVALAHADSSSAVKQNSNSLGSVNHAVLVANEFGFKDERLT